MNNRVKSGKRALRRHHAQRKHSHAVRLYRDWQMVEGNEKWLRRNFDNLAVCSCWMCGHRRKSEGLTMREKHSLLALDDEN